MPSYFFHVEFELYGSRDCLFSGADGVERGGGSVSEREGEGVDGREGGESESRRGLERTEDGASGEASGALYIPAPGTDIFRAKLPDTTCGVAGVRESVVSRVSGGRLTRGGREVEKEGGLVDGEKESAASTRGRDKRVRDWRFGAVSIESINMRRATMPVNQKGSRGSDGQEPENKNGTGTGTTVATGPATLGQYVPAETATTDVGWGVVHLYRDAKETVELENRSSADTTRRRDVHTHDNSRGSGASSAQDGSFKEKDCTTLCVLAVPSYMTSSDLLGFVGERTREDVSHFRLIRTARANKYMVLMKFRDAGRARVWQREWNGKLFNSMEVMLETRNPIIHIKIGYLLYVWPEC